MDLHADDDLPIAGGTADELRGLAPVHGGSICAAAPIAAAVWRIDDGNLVGAPALAVHMRIAEAAMADWALNLENVRAGYGETVVLEDIRFALGPSETVSIIGRNGVGKTTLLATIMGHTTLHGGRIALHGKDISSVATYRRVTAGLGYVPQEREIFPSLTLRENLEVAARPGAWSVETVFELFPRLAERADNRGNQLSGGEQQMLAIGRALIGNPTVLLMDEPSEGLAPVIVEELARAVKRLTQSSGLAIVLVEQNTRLALDIAPRAVVMDRGRIVYDGASEALRKDPAKLEQLIGVVKA